MGADGRGHSEEEWGGRTKAHSHATHPTSESPPTTTTKGGFCSPQPWEARAWRAASCPQGWALSEELGAVPTKGFMEPQNRSSNGQGLRVLPSHWGLAHAQLVLPKQGGRGGAGGGRQGPEAQAQAKARTSGTWALETMGGAGATGRGAADPAPTLPTPCGCRAPLQKRGPLSENGVLRPGQPHWITTRVPGSLRGEGDPRPTAASIPPAWLWSSLRFPVALVVGEPPGLTSTGPGWC